MKGLRKLAESIMNTRRPRNYPKFSRIEKELWEKNKRAAIEYYNGSKARFKSFLIRFENLEKRV